MRRRDTRRVFAEITAVLEDTHSVAVEGQAPCVTADMVSALVAHVREGVRKIEALMIELDRHGGRQ